MFSSFFAWRIFLPLAAAGLSALQATAQVQPVDPLTALPSVTTTLRQALDAAWVLSPQSRTSANRLAELQARQSAAGSWISGEPVATLAHRTDRLNANSGFREYEAEVELPLFNPGVRSATQRQIAAERLAFEPQQALARLKLAGELRELAASLATAGIEQELAQRKLAEARTLTLDVERRVKAGDTARVDALLAQALVHQADAALQTASSSQIRLTTQWRALTGLPTVPTASLAETSPPSPALDPSAHPAIQAAQTQLQAALARLALTETDRRDPMVLGAGMSRERPAFGAGGETTLRLALKIPLGGENRNAPRLAAARAELDDAQAQLDAAIRQSLADVDATTAELAAARRTQVLASQRAALSGQVQALVTKAFRLGEADLPSRLRTDNEKFEADLAEARARTDVQRAVSKLNQALGLMP